jgi:hypothetical protein
VEFIISSDFRIVNLFGSSLSIRSAGDTIFSLYSMFLLQFDARASSPVRSLLNVKSWLEISVKYSCINWTLND